FSAAAVVSTTFAQVSKGALVTVGNGDVVDPGANGKGPTDYHASTVVQANDSTDVVNFAGSLLTAKNAGIGASAGFTFVSRDTEAFISDLGSVASPVDAFLVTLATQFNDAAGAFCGSHFPLSLLDQLGLTGGAGSAPTPAAGSKVDSRGSVLV